MLSNIKLKKLHRPNNTRGDTIIEVLISMSILALVLGATYATSSRSLRTGTAATQRNQALSIAQNQVEVIKNAYETNPVLLADLQNPASGGFCLDAANLTTGTRPTPSTATTCTKYQGEDYAVRVNFDATRQIFNVDVEWSSATGTAVNSKVQLLYKIPGGYARPGVQILSFTATPSTINLGQSTALAWTANYTTGCTVSGNGISSGSYTGGASGGITATPTTSGIITYTLNCAGATPATRTTNVTVNGAPSPPAPTITSFTCSPSSTFPLGGSCTLTLASPNATTCTFTGSNGLNTSRSGSGTFTVPGISPIVGIHTFNASCVNGTSPPTSATPITVTVTGSGGGTPCSSSASGTVSGGRTLSGGDTEVPLPTSVTYSWNGGCPAATSGQAYWFQAVCYGTSCGSPPTVLGNRLGFGSGPACGAVYNVQCFVGAGGGPQAAPSGSDGFCMDFGAFDGAGGFGGARAGNSGSGTNCFVNGPGSGGGSGGGGGPTCPPGGGGNSCTYSTFFDCDYGDGNPQGYPRNAFGAQMCGDDGGTWHGFCSSSSTQTRPYACSGGPNNF